MSEGLVNIMDGTLKGKFGRIQEDKPPNCKKVYIIPLKAYFLVRSEYLSFREENKIGNNSAENLDFGHSNPEQNQKRPRGHKRTGKLNKRKRVDRTDSVSA